METARFTVIKSQIYFIKIHVILETGSHSLIIGLSNDVFFSHISSPFKKISEIEAVDIGGGEGASKTNKN